MRGEWPVSLAPAGVPRLLLTKAGAPALRVGVPAESR